MEEGRPRADVGERRVGVAGREPQPLRGEAAGGEHQLELLAELRAGAGIGDELGDRAPRQEDAGLLAAGAQQEAGLRAEREDGGEGDRDEGQEEGGPSNRAQRWFHPPGGKRVGRVVAEDRRGASPPLREAAAGPVCCAPAAAGAETIARG